MTGGQQNTTTGAVPPVPEAVRGAPDISVPQTGAGEIASAGDSLTDHHLEFATFQEGYVRNYISLADTKGGWAFTVASGVLVYLIGKDSIRAVLLAPAFSFQFILACACVLLLGLSAFFAFRVIAPRLASPSGEGIVFFGAVAKHPNATAYIDAVESRSARDLIEVRLKHCFDVSRVCEGKYDSLKASIWLGLPALLATFALLLQLKT